MSPFLVSFVATALLFGFVNGFQNSANAVATMISSRAMGPRKALAINAVANFVGPFLFGVAIAATIGREVVAEQAATLPVVLSALLGAIVWNIITWLLGIPSSSSHALIGGLVGVAATEYGVQSILLPGLTKVLLTLFFSPIIGLVSGYLLMKVIFFLARGATPRVNVFFKRVLRPSDHPAVAEDHAVRAKALENRLEWVYREALAALFHMPRDVDHVVEMLKLREIYRHLSNAADRGDEAANVITDIVVKMT